MKARVGVTTTILLIAASGIPVLPQRGPMSPSFEILAQLVEQQVKLVSPARLNLALKNTSASVIIVRETNPEVDYDLEVRGPNNQVVPLTEYGKRLREEEERRHRSIAVELKPGEEVCATLDVKNNYELPWIGTYYIKAMRTLKIPGTNRREKIISNTVELIVLADFQ